MQKQNEEKAVKSEQAKKAYESPRLITHGTVEKLTLHHMSHQSCGYSDLHSGHDRIWSW